MLLNAISRLSLTVVSMKVQLDLRSLCNTAEVNKTLVEPEKNIVFRE